MNAMWKMPGIVVSLGLLGATAATAQSWTITIGPGNAVTSTTLQEGAVNVITQSQATVNVECQSGVDCSQADLHLELDGALIADLGPPASSAVGLTFTIPQSAVSPGTDLVVLLNGKEIDFYQIAPAAANGAPLGDGAQQPNLPPPAPPPTLAQLLALPCPGTYTVPAYDEKGNLGEVVVNPLGTVLASNLDTLFDEDDSLIVHIVADKRLLPLLTAARTSAFRDTTAVQIVGGGQQAPLLTRQAGLVPDCGEQKFLLSDFAPGEGQVQISALQGTQLTPLGSFDFNVNPLYTGMLTLGAARTDLVNAGFKIATVNGQTVIAAGEEGDQDLIYTLFYTPFVWGKRDLQKRVPWYKHLNPTIGVAPDDITDNAFIGVNADLPAGISLTFGRHFRQIEVLDQGLNIGSPFSGTADQLPTAQEWKDGNFWAVSIDLRVMVQVLAAAVGGGTGGGGS
jgi:hypothetical protein